MLGGLGQQRQLNGVYIFLLLLLPTPLGGQDFAIGDAVATSGDQQPQNYINFRAGVGSNSSASHPIMCLELAAPAVFALEACGSGRGFLYNQPGRELSHFHSKWKIKHFRVERQWLIPELALGFAELEVGHDRPGFRFSRNNLNAQKTSAAGPELATSLKWLQVLPKNFEVLGTLAGGLAWIPAAPVLISTPSMWQPFVGLSLGFGW